MNPAEQPRAGYPGSELRPPGSQPHSGPGPNDSKSAKHRLVWGALAVIILLGLAVVLVLPGMVSGPEGETPTDGSGQVTSASAESAELAGQGPESSSSDATQALQDFLHSRARLELANAPEWGEPEWSEAVAGAARGNDLFGQSQFSLAKEAFTQSLDLLLRLESGSGQRLANALDSGWQALRIDDSASAQIYFQTALSIEADNESALEGRQRARVRPDLLGLMAAAEVALSMNNLPRAQAAYRQAVALDGEYEPARIALQDITGQITGIAFNDAMSRALAALDAEQTETAEVALQQAESLKSGELVVRDMRYELAQLRQKLWLDSQRQQALAKERNEDWSDAVALYREVLASVPQAAFARQGLEKAEDRERLHQQLDHYLADPARVYSAEPRANAEQLIVSAGKPPAEETRLAAKVSRLQALIIEAQTPQTVTMQSDGLTSVSIHHVGRLGTFLSQQLELPPGTYIVVGSRPGYRDVRQTFTVRPGPDQPALVIRCEEPV